VEIEMDGRLGMTMDLDDRAWRPIELVLAPPPTSGPARRLSLRSRTEGCQILAGPLRLR
jgi:hypothetical protein